MQSSDARFRNIKKIGGHTRWSQDFYHYLLLVTWPRFFAAFVGFFLVFNIIFGVLYWIIPGALSGTDGSLFQSFLFSVQTYTTVGYGSFAPASALAHVIMVCESLLMLFSSAALTGLVFAKFSRPNAKIIFSKSALISQFDGKKCLMMRMGNLRNNTIAEAQVSMLILKTFVTSEGQQTRGQVDLKLRRRTSLFFALSWLVVHEIDEQSPIYGLTSEDLIRQNIELAVSVIGNDSTVSQAVHAGCIYSPDEIIFDRYFEDVIESENGRVKAINYKKFHDLKA